ncbi:hypothetical protein [Maribacter sp. HTCC2170]|uniref:hypothetical protein n=1 Tax=Maribacter sp. (strain HTCC2170 / KCCM 42371) TaxID=313603 RepID=UPI00006AFC57|nr:hypothetical protein [Maribacter sp. HTCC2170]EAR01427.1 hypothetical protein FB2170_11921 [Maribacter sp. HTCC2170]
MELFREFFVPWGISNLIAILILSAAIRLPKLARLLIALLFFWAFWLNLTTSQYNPGEYLNYAKLTPFSWLADFINGWFKPNITLMVTIIAIGQGLIGIGLLLKNQIVRIACYGAIVFFIAIIPLGIGAAFPATLITALAVYFILKKDDLDYIWKFKAKK